MQAVSVDHHIVNLCDGEHREQQLCGSSSMLCGRSSVLFEFFIITKAKNVKICRLGQIMSNLSNINKTVSVVY